MKSLLTCFSAFALFCHVHAGFCDGKSGNYCRYKNGALVSTWCSCKYKSSGYKSKSKKSNSKSSLTRDCITLRDTPCGDCKNGVCVSDGTTVGPTKSKAKSKAHSVTTKAHDWTPEAKPGLRLRDKDAAIQMGPQGDVRITYEGKERMAIELGELLIQDGLDGDDVVVNGVPLRDFIQNIVDHEVAESKRFRPKSKSELADAIEDCMDAEDYACTKGPHGPIGTWDVSAVTDMRQMFSSSKFNGDLSKWDVSKVTDMGGMFNAATSFNSDLSNWDVSRVTNMYRLFDHASSFNSDLSKWDVSRVADMGHMFDSATSFNSDLSKWDVSRVIYMEYMFRQASSFNSDLSKWDVSKVRDMSSMFYGASKFDKTLCHAWKAAKWKASMKSMFTGSNGRLCN